MSRHLRKFTWPLTTVLSVLGCLLVLQTVHAQDVEPGELKFYKEFDRYRYFPKIPGERPKPEGLPAPDYNVTGSEKILTDELVGLVFVDDPAEVSPSTVDIRGIQVRSSGLRLLRTPAFQRVVEPYLGQPVSLRMLNMMIRDIIIYYGQHDRPVVDVAIPRQEITNGVVQLVVTEARIGQIRVEGACFFDPEELLSQTWLCRGALISEAAVLEDLEWLARDPFRDVTLELQPGNSRGLTDVVYLVDDELPFSPYFGYEDTGNIATGRDRTFYGFNEFDIFGTDDNFNYQYTTDSQFSRLHAHSASYSTDFDNRDNLTVFGSYAEFNTALGAQNTAGFTWQLLTRYTTALREIGDYEHNLILGYDFKRSNTNLDLGGINVFDNTGDVSQLMLGYQGSRTGDGSAYYLGAEGFYSPGTISGGSTGRAYRAIRNAADPAYAYLRAYFESHVQLDEDLEFVLRGSGQLSEGNLLPTEVFGIGGYNSVRGYDFYSVVGDSGYFVNAELWTRPITFGRSHGGASCSSRGHAACTSTQCGQSGHLAGWRRDRFLDGDQSLRFLAFCDIGHVYQHTPLPVESNSIDLLGVGIGFRYQLGDRIQWRTDYGWQLQDLPVLLRDSRFHVGVVISL